MFKKILLPLDLTDHHGPALNTAGELVKKNGGELILLHVIETIPGLPVEEEKNFYRRLQHTATEHLGHLIGELRIKKIPCRFEVRLGHRAQEALKFAGELACDLIVLTAPPFQPENPVSSLGSLGWKIGVMAPCPVLLVKGHGH